MSTFFCTNKRNSVRDHNCKLQGNNIKSVPFLANPWKLSVAWSPKYYAYVLYKVETFIILVSNHHSSIQIVITLNPHFKLVLWLRSLGPTWRMQICDDISGLMEFHKIISFCKFEMEESKMLIVGLVKSA